MIRKPIINNRYLIRKRLHNSFSIYYFNRSTGKLNKEQVPAEKWIKWLYNTPLGNIALESVIKRKGLSKLYGRYMDSKMSTVKIKSFIELFNIDINQYEVDINKCKSFNDFFMRKLKPGLRRCDESPLSVISPADGKIVAFNNLHKNYRFLVKGYRFSLAEFLNNHKLAAEYENGSMFIVRLTPVDYHWFHFPVDGIPAESHLIRGKYYSVSPISIHKKTKTFEENKREYTIINTKYYDDIIMAEIGATFVGCVKQVYMPYKPYRKGDVKGYFKFGGSSVILLFKENIIKIDDDLLQNSRLSYETEIKLGEKIAVLSDTATRQFLEKEKSPSGLHLF